MHETIASSERGVSVVKSFTASSRWWWIVDRLFMAVRTIRECGDGWSDRG